MNHFEQFNTAIIQLLTSRRQVSDIEPAAIKHQADGENLELFLYDVIGADFFFGGVSALDVAQLLSEQRDAATVTVRINSPGGDVFDAVAIYSALLAHPGEVVVQIDGQAASAASVIAMAGERILMAAQAQIMLHRASTAVMGNTADMQQMSDLLKTIDENSIALYAERSGSAKRDIRALVDAETWLTSDQAIEQGLADGLIEQISKPTRTSAAKQKSRSPRSWERRFSVAAFFKEHPAMTKQGSTTEVIDNPSKPADEPGKPAEPSKPAAAEQPAAPAEGKPAADNEQPEQPAETPEPSAVETTEEKPVEQPEPAATYQQLAALPGASSDFICQSQKDRLTIAEATHKLLERHQAASQAAGMQAPAAAAGLAEEQSKPKRPHPLGDKIGAYCNSLTLKK